MWLSSWPSASQLPWFLPVYTQMIMRCVPGVEQRLIKYMVRGVVHKNTDVSEIPKPGKRSGTLSCGGLPGPIYATTAPKSDHRQGNYPLPRQYRNRIWVHHRRKYTEHEKLAPHLVFSLLPIKITPRFRRMGPVEMVPGCEGTNLQRA